MLWELLTDYFTFGIMKREHNFEGDRISVPHVDTMTKEEYFLAINTNDEIFRFGDFR